ncbi:acyl carrier protein [Clostridium sp.]|uniref:acyl carrier protein n=1 Tax=Clostridium sp. TaxID=1506 RepID=UPI003D6D4A88
MKKEDVIKLWSEILKKDNIDENKNFFENGGDSLKVMKVLQRAEEEYGVNIDIMNFFQDATIECITGVVKNEG